MTKRFQLNVRIKPNLYEKFQQKLQKSGESTSQLITRWIESFVKEPYSSFSESSLDSEMDNSAKVPLEILGQVNEKLDELNQKVNQLEEQHKLLLTLLELQSNSFALKLKQKDHYLA